VTFKEVSKSQKSGNLKKQGGKWKSWNPRWCVLTEKALYYFKSEPPKADDEPEGGLWLDECDISPGEDKLKKKHCFSIVTHGRVYFIIANSGQEMHDWMNIVHELIERSTNRQPINFADNTLGVVESKTSDTANKNASKTPAQNIPSNSHSDKKENNQVTSSSPPIGAGSGYDSDDDIIPPAVPPAPPDDDSD